MRKVLASAAVALSCAACAQKPAAPPIPTAPPGGALVAFRRHIVAVEIAAAKADWERGLMHRTSLPRDAGMVFLFPAPTKTAFWMKDTLIPLSIAFLKRQHDQTYTVAKLLDMTPCHTETCPLYDPKTSYDAALEVNRGWFRRHGVHVGSTGSLGRAVTGT